jgi:hypothetical protein
MGNWGIVLFSLLFFSLLFLGTIAVALRTEGSEEWGYVQVRPSKPMVLNCINFHSFFLINFLKQRVHIYTEAHMFWCFKKFGGGLPPSPPKDLIFYTANHLFEGILK